MEKSKIAEKSEKFISISIDLEKKNITQIIDWVSSYVEDDIEMSSNLKKNKWIVTSFVLCKLNNWYTNDYLETKDIIYYKESYQGSVVELNNNNSHYKDIIKLSYDKIFINVMDNIFNEIKYDQSDINLFDLKSVFKYVYNYYLSIKNEGGTIDTCVNNWLNYTWGMLRTYNILNIDLSLIVINKVRDISNLIIKIFNNDIIYFDTDTIWLKRLSPELLQFNHNNNLRIMKIENIKNFIILSKKKYIEIYDNNFLIKGIR